MAPAVEMDAVSVGSASAKLLRFLAAESGGVHVTREYASAIQRVLRYGRELEGITRMLRNSTLLVSRQQQTYRRPEDKW